MSALSYAQYKQITESAGWSWDYMSDRERDMMRAVADAAIAAEIPEVPKLLSAVKYIIGIAERGEGRRMRDDESAEQFVLGYVKKLEAIAADRAARAEPVAWVEVIDQHEGPYNFHGLELLPRGKHHLYTAPPAAPVSPEGWRNAVEKGLLALNQAVNLNQLGWQEAELVKQGRAELSAMLAALRRDKTTEVQHEPE